MIYIYPKYHIHFPRTKENIEFQRIYEKYDGRQ